MLKKMTVCFRQGIYHSLLGFLFIIFSLTGLSGCHKQEAANVVSVGTIAGPETELMAVAKRVAHERYGLIVKIRPFSDYNIPNQALASGNIDANMFQTLPFLKAQIRARDFKLVAVAKGFIYPMGLYSKKIKSLAQLQKGAKVAIPNDPSNEARALLLLQKAKLIRLKPNVGINATPIDILSNPKHLKIIELEAPELPRALSDVEIAAINTTYTLAAGLTLEDALFKEGNDSLYVNWFVTRENNKDSPKVQKLIKAFQSQPVIEAAEKIFKGSAIPGWSQKK